MTNTPNIDALYNLECQAAQLMGVYPSLRDCASGATGTLFAETMRTLLVKAYALGHLGGRRDAAEPIDDKFFSSIGDTIVVSNHSTGSGYHGKLVDAIPMYPYGGYLYVTDVDAEELLTEDHICMVVRG